VCVLCVAGLEINRAPPLHIIALLEVHVWYNTMLCWPVSGGAVSTCECQLRHRPSQLIFSVFSSAATKVVAS
jgi:hypothetical protein